VFTHKVSEDGENAVVWVRKPVPPQSRRNSGYPNPARILESVPARRGR